MANSSINSFNFKGKSSLDFGLYIYKKNVFDAPARDVQILSVPGKSGNLIIDNNRFENIEIKYECNIMPERRCSDLAELSRSIKGWLLAQAGYFPLSDTYNKNYFRLAAYHSALNIDEFISQFGKAPISFTCKPLLYSFAGQTPVVFTAATQLLNAEAFPSAPYFKITGSGDITLYVNNDAFNFSDVEDFIEVDSEMMNAFKGIIPQNLSMSAVKFPVLYPGINNISWTGNVSAVKIIPRWCSL